MQENPVGDGDAAGNNSVRESEPEDAQTEDDLPGSRAERTEELTDVEEEVDDIFPDEAAVEPVDSDNAAVQGSGPDEAFEDEEDNMEEDEEEDDAVEEGLEEHETPEEDVIVIEDDETFEPASDTKVAMPSNASEDEDAKTDSAAENVIVIDVDEKATASAPVAEAVPESSDAQEEQTALGHDTDTNKQLAVGVSAPVPVVSLGTSFTGQDVFQANDKKVASTASPFATQAKNTEDEPAKAWTAPVFGSMSQLSASEPKMTDSAELKVDSKSASVPLFGLGGLSEGSKPASFSKAASTASPFAALAKNIEDGPAKGGTAPVFGSTSMFPASEPKRTESAELKVDSKSASTPLFGLGGVSEENTPAFVAEVAASTIPFATATNNTVGGSAKGGTTPMFDSASLLPASEPKRTESTALKVDSKSARTPLFGLGGPPQVNKPVSFPEVATTANPFATEAKSTEGGPAKDGAAPVLGSASLLPASEPKRTESTALKVDSKSASTQLFGLGGLPQANKPIYVSEAATTASPFAAQTKNIEEEPAKALTAPVFGSTSLLPTSEPKRTEGTALKVDSKSASTSLFGLGGLPQASKPASFADAATTASPFAAQTKDTKDEPAKAWTAPVFGSTSLFPMSEPKRTEGTALKVDSKSASTLFGLGSSPQADKPTSVSNITTTASPFAALAKNTEGEPAKGETTLIPGSASLLPPSEPKRTEGTALKVDSKSASTLFGLGSLSEADKPISVSNITTTASPFAALAKNTEGGPTKGETMLVPGSASLLPAFETKRTESTALKVDSKSANTPLFGLGGFSEGSKSAFVAEAATTAIPFATEANNTEGGSAKGGTTPMFDSASLLPASEPKRTESTALKVDSKSARTPLFGLGGPPQVNKPVSFPEVATAASPFAAEMKDAENESKRAESTALKLDAKSVSTPLFGLGSLPQAKKPVSFSVTPSFQSTLSPGAPAFVPGAVKHQAKSELSEDKGISVDVPDKPTPVDPSIGSVVAEKPTPMDVSPAVGIAKEWFHVFKNVSLLVVKPSAPAVKKIHIIRKEGAFNLELFKDKTGIFLNVVRTDPEEKLYLSLRVGADVLKCGRIKGRPDRLAITRLGNQVPKITTEADPLKFFAVFPTKEASSSLFAAFSSAIAGDVSSSDGDKNKGGETESKSGPSEIKAARPQSAKISAAKPSKSASSSERSSAPAPTITKSSKLEAKKKLALQKMKLMKMKGNALPPPLPKASAEKTAMRQVPSVPLKGAAVAIAKTSAPAVAVPMKVEVEKPAGVSGAKRQAGVAFSNAPEAKKKKGSEESALQIMSTTPSTGKKQAPTPVQMSPPLVATAPSAPKKEANIPKAAIPQPAETSKAQAIESSQLRERASYLEKQLKELSSKYDLAVASAKDFEKSAERKLAEALQRSTAHEGTLQDLARNLESIKNQSVQLKENCTSVSRTAEELIDSGIEGLNAVYSRLNECIVRIGTEPPVSLSQCRPHSVEDFFHRLWSFQPSRWFGFAEKGLIDPLECALRGWYNSSENELSSSDGATIQLDVQAMSNPELYEAEVNRVRALILGKGHALLSGWLGNSCPNEFRALSSNSRDRASLAKCVSDLKTSHIDNFVALNEKHGFGLDVATTIAVHNWSIRHGDEEQVELQCEWCNRRCVVKSAQQVSQFDVQSSHFHHCPYRKDSAHSENLTILKRPVA